MNLKNKLNEIQDKRDEIYDLEKDIKKSILDLPDGIEFRFDTTETFILLLTSENIYRELINSIEAEGFEILSIFNDEEKTEVHCKYRR